MAFAHKMNVSDVKEQKVLANVGDGRKQWSGEMISFETPGIPDAFLLKGSDESLVKIDAALIRQTYDDP